MSDVPGKVVVVGGGQAAASAVASLRQWKFAGDITLIGDEDVLPYQRPPLSKGYMKGEVERERLFLKSPAWYRDSQVDVQTGQPARKIEISGRAVVHDSGTLDYDALILATGSRPRLLDLPGSRSKNVLYLRNLADVDRIRPHLVEGRRMVVIGAGYIGLEAAAAARQCGLSVTVLEYAPRVLARVTSPVMSDFFEKEHRARGVDIVTDARIEGFATSGENVTAVDMADGTSLRCDVVLIGIGIVPNVELASAAGLECDDGIVVDRDARTSNEAIYAAGDVTSRPLVHYDRRARLESVHNAIEQGKLAAAAILGRPRPPEDCPWFWSDQFDLKLQIAGLSEGYSDYVVRGSESDRHFAIYYLDDHSRLLAVDAVNAPQDFVLSKRLIIAGARVDADQLADTQVPLKELVATALAR